MSTHVPVDIFSPDQLSGLIAELQAYRGKLRDMQVRTKTVQNKSIELPELSEPLVNLLRSSNVAPEDGQKIEGLQKELAIILKTAPVAHITLAASAGRTLKRQLTVWFRTQIHPHTLLTFATRSDIGGGLLLHAGSHFYDFSFRNLLLANKNRLTEIAGV